jgi:hypothetical protein
VAIPKYFAVPLAVLSTFSLAGCNHADRSGAGISVTAHFDPQPVKIGPETVTIAVMNASQQPVAHATVSLEADMSHPGMSPVFGNANEVMPGTYTGKIGFTMAGDWVLLVNITLPDNRKIERQIDVPGVRPN